MPVQTRTTRQRKSAAPGAFATINVNTEHYLAMSGPARIKKRLSIALSSHSYLPRVDDLESDWVAHVAAPAFKLFRRQRNDASIDSFASIGTGSGLDVLTGVEILGARRVGLTDVHEDVVATAAGNVARNHLASHPLVIESGHGDLLEPLRRFNSRYDVIYENLPNVPSTASDVAVERKSSTHLAPRKESVPERIRQQMLDLHYLALAQAKDFLQPGGAVFSTLGGRVPLKVFLELAAAAGYSASFHTFTWKVQADPLVVIRDHARKQQEGFGPFYFYRATVLEKTFANVNVSSSGPEAFEIEKSLLPERLDSAIACAALQKGERIGHTVAVLKSELK